MSNLRFQMIAAFALLILQSTHLLAQFSGGGAAGSPVLSNATLKRECDRGSAASCGELGQRYQDDGEAPPEYMKRGFNLFKRACDGGDAVGCGDLAQAYLFGQGVARDEVRGARLSEQVCSNGNMIGCSLMGIVHEQGKAGYPKDAGKAVSYFRKACNQSQPRWEFPCKRVNELATQGQSPSIPSASAFGTARAAPSHPAQIQSSAISLPSSNPLILEYNTVASKEFSEGGFSAALIRCNTLLQSLPEKDVLTVTGTWIKLHIMFDVLNLKNRANEIQRSFIVSDLDRRIRVSFDRFSKESKGYSNEYQSSLYLRNQCERHVKNAVEISSRHLPKN